MEFEHPSLDFATGAQDLRAQTATAARTNEPKAQWHMLQRHRPRSTIYGPQIACLECHTDLELGKSRWLAVYQCTGSEPRDCLLWPRPYSASLIRQLL